MCYDRMTAATDRQQISHSTCKLDGVDYKSVVWYRRTARVSPDDINQVFCHLYQ